MYPILLSIGSFHIYTLGVFLLLAWLVFSFLFWKQLRGMGIDEDKIFDLTFYATLIALIASRALFVFLHWELFFDTWLKIFAPWVQSGFSGYGAFVGGLMTLVSMSRHIKVRLGHVLDAVALSFPASMLVGLVGIFLDGSTPGKIVDVPWALRVVGHVGKRHPIQIYEIIALCFLIVILAKLHGRSSKERWPYGMVGVWFFILYSVSMFALEFFKDSRVYWISLSANQWILIAIFAEALGAFYVRGGGRESLRPLGHKIKSSVRNVIGGIHAKFSIRRTK